MKQPKVTLLKKFYKRKNNKLIYNIYCIWKTLKIPELYNISRWTISLIESLSWKKHKRKID
jgi:hypothetical protein